MLCFLFSDWALRFNKLIGSSAGFGIESFCYTLGLYLASIPLFCDNTFENIENFSTNSISSNYRIGSFIVVFFLSAFIYFTYEGNQNPFLLKYLCLAFGIGSILIIYLDFLFSSRIKSVSDFLGSLLVSELVDNRLEIEISQKEKVPIELNSALEATLLNIKKTELKRRSDIISKNNFELATKVSHDIRSPLCARVGGEGGSGAGGLGGDTGSGFG